MLIHEIFAKDPLNYRLANNGVASGTEPARDEEWQVLRQELQNFICDGEYRRGFEQVLRSYLDAFESGPQKAVWVSGFYGSGKSHFVRVLKFLWANKPLPDGAEPRSLVSNLPLEVRDLFKELNTRAKPHGGLWSAIGTLGKGAKDSPRLAFLGIAFTGARLPAMYPAAKFVLWLRRQGWEEKARAAVAAAGKVWHQELLELYVSPVITEAVLKAYPDFAASPAKAREALKAQFPPVKDITDEELVATLEELLGGESTVPGQLPLSLLVVDELQQYIGDDSARTLDVQEVIESCSKRFGGRLMIVATGQSAMGGTQQLGKLQGRFPLRVQLSDADALCVVREVVLLKREDKREDVHQVMQQRAGEIDRQLAGSRLASDASDRPYWVADYPILAARRRFWETALRSVDRSGGAAQLRTQLQAVHEAIRNYAERPLGHVVGADVLYDQLRSDMLENGALQVDTDTTIRLQEKEGTPASLLRARILKTTFLLNQIPADFGLLATPDVLGDLLVEDLASAPAMRQQIPQAIEALTQKGQLLPVGGQFRVQTRESAAWTADFRAAENRIKSQTGRITADRAAELKAAFNNAVGKASFTQGECKQPRDFLYHFGDSPPQVSPSGVPVWVRDYWNTTEKQAREDAVALGMESPIVHVFLPSRDGDALRDALAAFAAANEVLTTRGNPTTKEGEEARASMNTQRDNARRTIDALLGRVMQEANVFLSGGGDAAGADLRATLLAAAEKSLVRLYPRFAEADHGKWGDVLKRVRDGGKDALHKVGYDGEPEKHPVCSTVLQIVGAGKKGSEVRRLLAAAPYGWPQDAIDSALLLLTATEHLSATRNGVPVKAGKIGAGEINQTEFKREHITLTLSQKVDVKNLLTALGIPVTGEDLPGACSQLISRLETLAAMAGGPPPAPAPPSPADFDELKSSSGNALALAVWEKRAALQQHWNNWTARAEAMVQRLQRWQAWERMLAHATGLSAATNAAAQRDAIKANRSLLQDPDPVPSLCTEVVDALRKSQQELREAYNQDLEHELQRLRGHEVWQKLPAPRAQELMEEHQLVPEPAVALGTEEEVITAAAAMPLALWRARITSIPGAVDNLLAEAIKELAPEAVQITPPGAELHSESDLDEYLARLRSEVMAHLAAGKPVVI